MRLMRSLRRFEPVVVAFREIIGFFARELGGKIVFHGPY